MKTRTMLFCLSIVLILQFLTGCTQTHEKPALAQVKPGQIGHPKYQLK